MQYILQEEEYAGLVRRQDVAKAAGELEQELRELFQSMCRYSMCLPQDSGFQNTREFKEYTDAFKKFANKI